jgi:hypothetical protein
MKKEEIKFMKKNLASKKNEARKREREREKKRAFSFCVRELFFYVTHELLYSVLCVCAICACVANYLKFCINLSAFSEQTRDVEKREGIIQK